MKLILTRHGETEENIQGILQGHAHGTLSAAGIQQAKALAEKLKTEHIEYIYSSDLGRSSNTTKEIIKHFPKVPAVYTQELRERDLGELQGKKKSELGLEKGQSHTFLDPKQGETLQQLYDRAKKFLKKIVEGHKEENILCVGHNGINKAIVASLQNLGPEGIRTLKNFGNASITIIDISDDFQHRVHIFDDTGHLRNARRED